MAFRKHNPNVLSPIFSDDSTWSTVACSKNKARPAASKENYGIPPQDLGTMLTDYGTDAEHTTPSNERTSWRHSNGSIVLREAFPKPARLANDFCASGTQRGFPHINNDGDSYQNKINEAWSGVESSNTTLHSPSSTSKVIQRPSNFACTAVVPRKEGENSSHRSKLMAWSEVESSNTALQSPSYASKVIQRPSPSSYSTRTALVPRKDCENRNHRATEIALIKPPPGMIRVVPRPNAFNMETLKPSLPVTLKVPTHVKMQSLAAPPNISSANKIMDYSAAARSFIPTPKAKKTIPTFPIYADRDLGLQPKLQTPPPALDSVEKYGRQLYNLSESAEPGSAEQAESILRTMIVNYMKGEHHIQPDGACYNRFVRGPSPRFMVVSRHYCLT